MIRASLESARALALALFLVGCGGAASVSPVATNQVSLPPSYRFAPSAITVPVGTTVTWRNSDNFTHSVRLLDQGGKVVGIMRPGQSVEFAFTSPGLYHYDCSFHPQNMKGTVKVTGS